MWRSKSSTSHSVSGSPGLTATLDFGIAGMHQKPSEKWWFYGEIIGKAWENDGARHGKHTKSYGKFGDLLETYGKYGDLWEIPSGKTNITMENQ